MFIIFSKDVAKVLKKTEPAKYLRKKVVAISAVLPVFVLFVFFFGIGKGNFTQIAPTLASL